MKPLGGTVGSLRKHEQAPVGAQEGLQISTWVTLSYAPPGLARIWLFTQGSAKNGSTLGY